MAPVTSEITDLKLSSLELDSRSSSSDLSSYLETLNLDTRDASTQPDTLPSHFEKRSLASDSSFSEDLNLIATRDAPKSANTKTNHGGAIDPSTLNMKGIQALFAIIGASFVLGAIWFFFWAKNGGFKWRRGDWEEYKSTVLRRKGPNGTTLSNATKSTRLGGGSVVGEGYSDRDGYTDDSRTVVTGTMTELSSSTAPIIKEKQAAKNKKKANLRDETAKERKQREMNEAQWEGGHDNDVRAYRHEKPARVGGINRDSDALHYGTDYTDTEGSNVSNNNRATPHRSSRNVSPEKRQSRRDFSFTQESERSSSPAPVRVPPPNTRPQRYHSPSKQPGANNNRQSMPGSYQNGHGAVPGYNRPMDFSDVQSQNTKSYHHPISGLNGPGGRAGGYRRDRGDGLDD